MVKHADTPYHNGGQLQFGSNGYLYISIGDGATGGANAANIGSLLGKIIRIIPRSSGSDPYTVPSSNPFVGRPGRDEIFAYGLRNPWRFSIANNRIAIGDVGENSWEEIDYSTIPAATGTNFGWPQYEGNALFNPGLPGPDPPRFPIFTYSHDNGRCAITGGFVVRDQALPSLLGRYIYGDLCGGVLQSLVPSPGGGTGNGPIGVSKPLVTSFGEGVNGAIYVAQLTGEVSHLVETP